MPTFDKQILGNKARDLGFIRDAFEKMYRLTEILKIVNADSELNQLLLLKGGTSINLTLFCLPRLSVDIDFDFAENMTKEETSVKREFIRELLGRYMVNEGYTLKEKSKHTHALDSFVYTYKNAAENPDNIKVEINYVMRCHVMPTIITMAQTGGIIADIPIRTLSPVEIFASKIVALSSRAAPRDLYDLNNMVCYYFFSKSEATMLRKCAVFYKAITGDTTVKDFSFRRIEKITPHRIRTELIPMLRSNEQFDLQAARERVTAFLNERMALTDKEAAFLKYFAENRYEPQLLFDDEEIIRRIVNHPMAMWRIRRI
ncbi:MAG: nucleotidyl transferase AbiEii/AbiGii toxin family protein [Oscillospiraceae bacterium]|nr:nucleotidyl transferase AbiEii/AbiGii toxin family protein [Oscillospiraceae bacterium]